MLINCEKVYSIKLIKFVICRRSRSSVVRREPNVGAALENASRGPSTRARAGTCGVRRASGHDKLQRNVGSLACSAASSAPPLPRRPNSGAQAAWRDRRGSGSGSGARPGRAVTPRADARRLPRRSSCRHDRVPRPTPDYYTMGRPRLESLQVN